MSIEKGDYSIPGFPIEFWVVHIDFVLPIVQNQIISDGSGWAEPYYRTACQSIQPVRLLVETNNLLKYSVLWVMA